MGSPNSDANFMSAPKPEVGLSVFCHVAKLTLQGKVPLIAVSLGM